MRLLLLAAALSRSLSLHAGEAETAPPPDTERVQWWRDARFGTYYSQPNWRHPDAFTDRQTS